MKHLSFKSVLLIVSSLMTLTPAAVAQENKELVILSSRKEPLIQPVIRLFEQQTGIKVIVKSGNAPALGQQIIQELPNSTADIYIAKEAGSLEYLRLQGALQPYASAKIEQVDQRFRARDGSWVGVSGRTRAIIYNTDLVKKEEVPATLAQLTEPKWKGKVAAANGSNESVVAWVSALRLTIGGEATKKFLTDLKANDIALLSDSHTDVRKAVGRGEFPIGLINSYYYHLQKHEPDPAVTHVGIVYLDQKPGERGELVNVSGAGIIKGAPHLTEAQQFMDFLVSVEAQKLFAEANYEFPLVPGVSAAEEVAQTLNCPAGKNVIDCLHTMNVHLDDLGPALESSNALLEEVNWF